MVDSQLKARDITDEKVLAAFAKVPREEFVPDAQKQFAYEDRPLPIGRGQTISQPYIVALMTQLLELKGPEKVLEIGTGSGYQAAILAEILKEKGGRVYSIERIAELAQQARQVLQGLGYDNVQVKVGDGSGGWLEAAPFNAIIVTAAAVKVPPALIDQLAEGGRLVIPVGKSSAFGGWGQELFRLTKQNGEVVKEYFGAVTFVPLISD